MKKSNRIINNAAWIILCRIVQSVMSFLIGTLTARYLGPSNYGIISYAGAIVAFLLPVVQLGFRSTLVYDLIDSPKDEGKILGTVLTSSFIASLLGMMSVALFVFAVNGDSKDTVIVCILYSISLLFQSLELIQYWFQAKLLSKYTSVVSLFAYFIVSIYKAYLLVSGKSVNWFALSYALDYFVVSFALIIIYHFLGGQKLKFSYSLFKKMFIKSKYYILSSLMVIVYQQTDRIMISVMLDEQSNGYYSAAFTTACIASFVFSAIIDSARPIILESKSNLLSFQKKMTSLFSIIIYLGFAQSIFFVIAASFCIEFLFGESYQPSIPILQVLTWYSTFSYIGSVRNIWILAESKQSVLWILNLCGAVFNIAGNLVLIPLCGSIGAAIASVVTYVFVDIVLCLIMRRTRPCIVLVFKSLDPRYLFKMFTNEKV